MCLIVSSRYTINQEMVKEMEQELILDRDEYDMLLTLNSLIKVPGLSTMKILCDESLEITEDNEELSESNWNDNHSRQGAIIEKKKSSGRRQTIETTLFDFVPRKINIKSGSHRKTHDLTYLTARKKLNQK